MAQYAGASSAAEQLVSTWRGAIESLCIQEGLDSGLCSVIITDIRRPHDAGVGDEGRRNGGQGGRLGGGGGRGAGREEGGREGAEGVHGFRDVEDWVKREAAAFYRMV